ncbi:tyrosine-type recombinase/integrase [Amycolatopsis azurea]|uniref:Putative integrase/recombinase, XerC and XerD family n=1 Tax=Amycolatopsis azurea DSM 43854 TaxID=1238180 RepID=M2QCA7_9PSEU|nr:putative integrase/recombinase, XerC and XerD family [Amycolatopsis azurea DSM 43854]OOC02951.1 hypothetical protein B0293_28650 [Amycolatopsis azurea DSM 43854]
MLRHSFASDLADAGAALDKIQRLLGHSRPSSADPYVHSASSRISKAVDRVPTPRAPVDTVMP